MEFTLRTSELPRAQLRDHKARQFYKARASLGLGLAQLPALPAQLPPHEDTAPIEFDIAPLKPKRLAQAQASTPNAARQSGSAASSSAVISNGVSTASSRGRSSRVCALSFFANVATFWLTYPRDCANFSNVRSAPIDLFTLRGPARSTAASRSCSSASLRSCFCVPFSSSAARVRSRTVRSMAIAVAVRRRSRIFTSY